MKKSPINAHLFLRDIGRSWPVWAGQLIAYFLLYIPQAIVGAEVTSYLSVSSLIFVCWVADVLLVLMVFGFMNNAPGANFFFSIPMRRESLFFTKLAVCVTAVFAPLLISASVTLIATGFHPVAWACALSLLLAHVTFLGISLLVMVAIGNSVAYAVVSLMLNFLGEVFLASVRSILGSSIYGFSPSGMRNESVFSPVITFMSGVIDFERVSDGPVTLVFRESFTIALILTGIGVVFAILAFLAFRRRRAESAGDVVAFKFLRPVLKYCAAVCAALLFTWMMTSAFRISYITPKNLPLVCLIIAVYSALGYFGAEMLIRKKFNVFRASYKGCIIAAAVLVALMTFVELDVLGVEKRVPDVGDIREVQTNLGSSLFEERESIERIIGLHQYLIAQKKLCENMPSGAESVYIDTPTGAVPLMSPGRYMYNGKSDVELADQWVQAYLNCHYPENIYLSYVLNDGSMLTRRYDVNRLYYDAAASEQFSRHAYGVFRSFSAAYGYQRRILDYGVITAQINHGDSSDNLDGSQSRQLYNAVIADMKELNIGVDEFFPPSPECPATLMNDSVVFKMKTDEKDELVSDGFAVRLDVRARNTLALLEEWGVKVS